MTIKGITLNAISQSQKYTYVYVLYDILMRQNYPDEEQTGGCQELGWGEDYKRSARESFRHQQKDSWKIQKYLKVKKHTSKSHMDPTRKSQEKIEKYFIQNKNKNTTYQNLCDAEKAMLTGKFIAYDSKYLTL